MRQAYSRATLGIALGLVLILYGVHGCATTTTAQQNAFNGLKTIRVGVEGALAVFNAGYQAGTYTEAQREQLRVLYTKYLAADKAAAEALLATMPADTGTVIARVTVVAADVIRFIQALKGGP